MNKVRVNLKNRSYDIIIAEGALNLLGRFIKTLKLGDFAYIITNSYIKRLYGRRLDTSLKKAGIERRFMLVADSEKSKSLYNAYSIIADITAQDRNKKIFIVAFGGGVIGDLSGFVASIYKRGIAYIQLPTTLLAQVDSSIGGKTAVDLKEGKNLVGAFYQPRLVCSDIAILGTLSKRQIKNGLAEVIKYGVIKDPAFFSYLERNYKEALLLKKEVIGYIVNRCSRIKADFVSRDEKEEKELRIALNFGHTIGHAIEAAGEYSGHSHGEAVALGMLVVSDISRRMGLLSESSFLRIEALIKNVGLPLRIKNISLAKIIKSYYHDKKFCGKKNRLVLINAIGKTKIVKGVPLSLIKEAIKARM